MGKHFISGALIDFLSVDQWTPDKLLQFAKGHGETESLYGDRHGYEPWIKSRAFPDKWFCYDPYDSTVKDLMAAGPAQELGIKNSQVCFVDKPDLVRFVLPGEPEHGQFFDYLTSQLKPEWIAKINAVQSVGRVDYDFLRGMDLELEQVFLDDFTPCAFSHVNVIETWLEREFFNLNAIMKTDLKMMDPVFFDIKKFGPQDTLLRMRECYNPDCGKWFVFNRPKQKFCCEHCRTDHHNRQKIQTGYLKDYQQKKRDEGHPAYFR